MVFNVIDELEHLFVLSIGIFVLFCLIVQMVYICLIFAKVKKIANIK